MVDILVQRNLIYMRNRHQQILDDKYTYDWVTRREKIKQGDQKQYWTE